MASSPSSRLTDLFYPGILVAALGVIGYFSQYASLDSARPQSESQGDLFEPIPYPTMGAQNAHMWEDPLSVYSHQKADNPSPANDDCLSFLKLLGLNSQPQVDLAKDIRDHFSIYVEKAETFVCLPVLVPGSPNADSEEQRRRIRYAVATALGEQGYQLKYNNRLSYQDLTINIYDQVSGAKSKPNKPFPSKVRIPVKLWVQPNEQHKPNKEAKPKEETKRFKTAVLVCWIDESRLGQRPVDALKQIMEGLFLCEARKLTHLRILGPSSSDMLETMHSELVAQPKRRALGQWADAPSIWSARATRHEWETDHNCFKDNDIKFVRTIGSDWDLQKALRWELKLRGKWPAKGNKQQKVVLITERDTSYGRAWGGDLSPDVVNKKNPENHELPLFQVELPSIENDEVDNFLVYPGGRKDNTQGKPISPEVTRALSKDQLLVFSFLRGLDGRSAESQLDEAKKSAGKGNADAVTLQQMDETRRTGRSQLDYLRRVEEELFQLHRNKQIEVKAIGVISTDIYDKLLVLRALRKRFPNACFFTTDLDVELWRPEELNWTRNLVVASHFGLRLIRKTDFTKEMEEGLVSKENNPLQGTVPPFRDSYQTSLFRAAQLALMDGVEEQCKDKTHTEKKVCCSEDTKLVVKPSGGLIYEIGRDRPYQLAGFNLPETPLHPPSDRQIEEDYLVSKFWLSIALIAAFATLLYMARIQGVISTLKTLWNSWGFMAQLIAKLSSDKDDEKDNKKNKEKNKEKNDEGEKNPEISIRKDLLFLESLIYVFIAVLIGWQIWHYADRGWFPALLSTIAVMTAFALPLLEMIPSLKIVENQNRWPIHFGAFAIILAPVFIELTSGRNNFDSMTLGALFGSAVLGLVILVLVAKKPKPKSYLHKYRRMFRANFGLIKLEQEIPSKPKAELETSNKPKKETKRWLYGLLFVAQVLMLFVIGLIYYDHSQANGEPFTLAGISMWPVTLVRAFLFVLSTALIIICGKSLEKNNREIRVEYGPLVEDRDRNNCWYQFLNHRAFSNPSHPAMPLVWVFLTMAILLFILTEFPTMPYRGELNLNFSALVLYLTLLSMCLLSFVVLDATQVTREHLRNISTPSDPKKKSKKTEGEDSGSSESPCDPMFPKSMVEKLAKKWNLEQRTEQKTAPITAPNTKKKTKKTKNTKESDESENAEKNKETKHTEKSTDLFAALEKLLAIRLFASRTLILGRMLLYPAIIILIMLVLRLTWLDQLDLTIPLVFVICVLLLVPIVYYYNLRRRLGDLRQEYLRAIRQMEVKYLKKEGEETLKELRYMSEEIEKENRGAFQPIAQDYIFKALALPFGGAGGLLLFQDLLRHLR